MKSFKLFIGMYVDLLYIFFFEIFFILLFWIVKIIVNIFCIKKYYENIWMIIFKVEGYIYSNFEGYIYCL